MSQENHKHPNTFLQKLLNPLSGVEQLRIEKARLEAFLDAVPGEYCGFTKDGNVIFSPGFAGFLKLNKIETIEDVQAALKMSDAAALEGQFYTLQKQGYGFSLIVTSEDESHIFRISGQKGQDLEGTDSFEILWLEDVTSLETEKLGIKAERDNASIEVKRLQNAIDCLPQMMWMRDSNHKITWCNNAYAVALGIDEKTVIENQKEIAVTKGKGPKAIDLARDALADGHEKKAQVHAIMNGKRRFIQISETPLPSSNQTLGMAQDITREEELEKEIKRYTAANKELMEQLRTAIAICNPDHELEFFNSAFSQLWGLEEQWLNTKPKFGEVLEKLRENRRLPEQSDFRKYKEGWLKMFTDLLDPHEDMMYLPDEKALRMLIIPNPVGGLILTFDDVTSRLELESSYNTLIAVQRETLDNLTEGVAAFGGDGRLKLWNPSFAKMWSCNPEDLNDEPHVSAIARKISKSFPDDLAGSQQENIVAIALDRNITEGRLILSEGVLVDYTSVPLPDGGVLISFYDVTDTVNVEKALREKNAALETAEQVKLDFLANVSYQLRTPLNALMGFNEILDNEYFGDLNEKQKEYTSGIHESGEQLMDLINDILDLSSLEAGYFDLDYEDCHAGDMLAGLYELTEEWARKEKIDLILANNETADFFYADQRRIKQVLLNLIRNAIHHTPEEGRITLSADKTNSHVIFSVTDTGSGIPKDAQEKIFQPFERWNNPDSKATARGAGLGLTLVKNIVALHNGEVEIMSEPSEGTTVLVKIPLDQGEKAA